MTYSINWPITVRSVPFRSGNYIFPQFRGIHNSGDVQSSVIAAQTPLCVISLYRYYLDVKSLIRRARAPQTRASYRRS